LTQIGLYAVGPSGSRQFIAADHSSSPDGLWVQNYLYSRSKTIAGGTTEVQLNVIAQSLFGA